MINIPCYAIFTTADVVALYPSTPHMLGLKALEETLEKWESILISISDFVKTGNFVLQYNYFDINGQTK